VELLARLGVGTIVVADPERVEVSNLSRLIAAHRIDAMTVLTNPRRPAWLQRVGERLSRRKVAVAKRNAHCADPSGSFIGLAGDITEPDVAAAFTECDFIFLAADSMQARL